MTDTASLPSAGGEDWLEACLWIEWDRGGSKGLFIIEMAASEAQSRNRQVHRTVGSRRIRVEPGRASVGAGAERRYLDWVLSVNGLRVLLSARRTSTKGLPSAVVTIDGRSCLAKGAAACWNDVLGFVGSIGGDVVKTTISRVDLCLDMPGQSIEPFAEAFDERRYVSKCKDRGFREGSGLTLYFGKRPWQARIYDKLAQVRSTLKGGGVHPMVERRWGGRDSRRRDTRRISVEP